MKKPAPPDVYAAELIEPERVFQLKKGLRLTIFTVCWNVIEGLVAITAGILANSVALISFGVDSFVETTSSVAVSWRLADEIKHQSPERAEAVEKITGRITGVILLLLAGYIVIDAGRHLIGFGEEADKSFIGIALTGLSVIVMPIVARAKLKVATSINSGSLRADAIETIACTWLSATTLLGLSLNALFSWTWADPLAALLIVPLVVKEGIEALKGEHCCGCEGK
ncbi:MAG: cation transporter [Candidatus Obscuribacterales bacterium]|nr:cation transporter [Candidatus Obscuribacterales bacterium]